MRYSVYREEMGLKKAQWVLVKSAIQKKTGWLDQILAGFYKLSTKANGSLHYIL